MTPKIKNIILFTIIALTVILLYVFFVKSSPDDTSALSSTPSPFVQNQVNVSENQPVVAQEFLSLLLSVKSIKLNVDIFSWDAFIDLDDSSITLTPDGNEGRSNPFAPIGIDSIDTSGTEDESNLSLDLDLDLDSDLDLDLDLDLDDLISDIE